MLSGDVIEVACMAHARRKFVDALPSDPRRASGAIDLIRRLYVIEREIHGRPPAEKLTARAERSKPILDEMKAWLDNNRAERALRGIAVGRKNWLFLGNDEGGRRAAIIYSLVATCKDHGVDPWAYLRDVIAILPTYRGDLAEITPPAWKRRQLASAGPPPDS